MSKIGIMSMQRIRNYGSFLQAYALKKIVESLGNNVEFVDYKYEGSIVSANIDFFSKIKNNINIIQFLKKRKSINEFRKIYDNEFLPKLGITDKRNYNKNIDTLIIGSDEVFNCLQPFPVGFSSSLFGAEYNNTNIISYAACFGYTTYEDIKKYNIDNKISSLLNNFKNISVRDKNSENIIVKLTGKKPEIHLDPVLIYDFKDKKNVQIDLKNYIIIYAYPGRLTKDEEQYIKMFAKRHSKTIISLGSYQRIADYIITVNPLEIFSYFEKADFVITDTFHGSIFSIKTEVNFCAIIRDSNDNKLSDLLDRLCLNSRKVKKLDDIEKLYNNKTDFSLPKKIICDEKQRTIDYLKHNM